VWTTPTIGTRQRQNLIFVNSAAVWTILLRSVTQRCAMDILP